MAQQPGQTETVMERPRPEVDALGMAAGIFRVYPAVGLERWHDSNLFADNNFEVDDQITVIKPKVVAIAEWSRADLELGADLAVGRYDDISAEDYEDLRVWSNLDVDLGRGLLTAEVRREDLHEQRTSPDNRRGIRPTEFALDSILLGYRNRFGQFDIGLELSRRALDYDDTATMAEPQSNQDRDRVKTNPRLRVGYGQSQRFQPFVRLDLVDIAYDQTFDRDGFQRSSDGFDIVGGTGIDLSGRAFGEVFAGYTRRDYDDAQFRQVDGPIFGGLLTWNISGLTTLQFSASRLVKSTTIVGAAGITDTSVEFKADHELLRNLILRFDIAANNEDFEGISRSDDIVRAGLEGIYMMNRYVQFRVGASFLSRDTSPVSVGGFEYDIQRFFIGIVGQI